MNATRRLPIKQIRIALKWKIAAPLLEILHRIQVPVILFFQRRGVFVKKSNSALISEVTLKSIDNLGDQAMVGGLVTLLRSRGINDIGIVTFGAQNDWTNLAGVHHAFSTKSLLCTIFLPWFMSRYQRLYYPGADVIDGAYNATMVLRVVYMMRLANFLGITPTICGFSFNTSPAEAAIRALRDLPDNVRLCCRDRISQQRVTTILHRPVQLVADVAFNLLPCKDSQRVQSVKDWIGAQHAMGRFVLGVNVHNQLAPADGPITTKRLLKAISAVLDELVLSHRFSLLFIPHVYRPKQNDLETLRTLCSEISVDSRRSSLLCESRLVACEVKAVCGQLDLVLTGRMHLAIASLGMGTPVVCLTYQDKFEGLMEHFDIAGGTLSPQNAADGDSLQKTLIQFLDRRDELKQKITQMLPKVSKLSTENVE